MHHYYRGLQGALNGYSVATDKMYMRIRVSRESAFLTTVMMLEDMSVESLHAPVTVNFNNEEGVDQGGPQKEYFSLCIAQCFNNPDNELFVRATSIYWFNLAQNGQSTRSSAILGRLIGLALFNGVVLELHFPPIFYKFLLDFTRNFEASAPKTDRQPRKFRYNPTWLLDATTDELLQYLSTIDPELGTTLRNLYKNYDPSKDADGIEMLYLSFQIQYAQLSGKHMVSHNLMGSQADVTAHTFHSMFRRPN